MSEARRRTLRGAQIGRVGSWILSLLGYRITLLWHPGSPHSRHGHFIVSNHVSFNDPMMIGSVFPTAFVTSKEVERDRLLGTLARLGGSFFVDRQNGSTLRQDIRDLREALSEGVNVGLFPEGTTSDASVILPFKRALLSSVAMAHQKILPLVINFVGVNGRAVEDRDRRALFYFGDVKFVDQMYALLKLRQIEVEIHILPEFEVGNRDSRELTVQLRDTLLSHFQAV